MTKLYFELKLVDDYGRVHGVVRHEIDEQAAFMGDRIADDVRSGLYAGPGETPFDSVVKVLKVRQFRKRLLIESARNVGHQLADFLEDREGWHGLDRQVGVEQALRAKP